MSPLPVRITVPSTAKMISTKTNLPVAPPAETTTLYGWQHTGGAVVVVRLDDGREMLVSVLDLTEVAS